MGNDINSLTCSVLTRYINTMKKKVIILLLFLFLNVCVLAQASRESLSFFRISGTYTNCTTGSKETKKYNENGKLGYSIELGGKLFFERTKGWFFEGSVHYFWTHLPFNQPLYWGDSAGSGESHSSFLFGSDHVREVGFGTKGVLGYDIILKNSLSLEIFTGPVLHYTTNFGPASEEYKQKLNRFNYRWQLGLGVNYKRFNMNFTFSNDLKNRGKTDSYNLHYRYRTYSFALGIAYRFSLSGENK